MSGSALLFSDYNIRGITPWSIWLLLSFLALLLYEIWWFRYFRRRTLRDFYSSFCGVLVAGAALPVLAFLLPRVYGRMIWTILFVLALGLGAGHIGIHLQH